MLFESKHECKGKRYEDGSELQLGPDVLERKVGFEDGALEHVADVECPYETDLTSEDLHESQNQAYIGAIYRILSRHEEIPRRVDAGVPNRNDD
jgi:hypothetical protein